MPEHDAHENHDEHDEPEHTQPFEKVPGLLRQATAHSYRFGPFSVEPDERRLLKDGASIALTPKAFDLLLVLVENPGRLLEKDALMKRLWADAFVEEANLANNISLLRKTLGQAEGGTDYIETVPRRGYRFLAEVIKFADSNGGQPTLLPSATPVSARQPDFKAAAAPSVAGIVARKRQHVFLALAALLAVVAGVVTLRRGDQSTSTPRVARFVIAPPPGASLPSSPQPLAPAMSPDGTRLVFRVMRGGEPLLAIHSIDALDTHFLAGTERARFAFWSPDNRVVAFFADGKLKRVNVSGGPVQTICDAVLGFGGTWNREGVIIFAPSAKDGLFKVLAAGGQPLPVTSLHKGETFHQHPQFLPDGRRFLYFAAPDGIFLGSLDGGTPIRILTNQRMALYSPPGYILFVQNRTLFAQPFDVIRARLSGDPVPLGDDVRTGGANVGGRAVGGAAISASGNGVLAYGTDAPIHARLAWLDRQGRLVRSTGPFPFEKFVDPELSPDGNQIAVADTSQGFAGDVWLFDLTHDRTTQLTFNSAGDRRPIWSPDGRRLVFASRRADAPGIYEKVVTGETSEALLLRSNANRLQWPSDWTSAGIVFESQDSGIWMLPLGGDRKPYPLVREQLPQPDAKLSADGRWLAYTSNQSDQSKRSEVFVQSVSTTGAKWRISTAGGSFPRWRRDGKELFYLASDAKVMAVRIEADRARLRPGVPEPLFQTGLSTMPESLRSFGVAPDGQRFLIAASEQSGSSSSLVVISNWPAALKP